MSVEQEQNTVPARQKFLLITGEGETHPAASSMQHITVTRTGHDKKRHREISDMECFSSMGIVL
jgi:hypothetical protein